MAYKVFAPGILTSSDMNTFLMNQAILVFSDSASRGSSIASPVEGMVSYLSDTDRIDKYTGSSFISIFDGYVDAYPASASGSVATGGTITLNVSTAQYHVVNLPTSGTATIAFSGIASTGKVHAWQVELVAGTATPGTVVFPAGVAFSGAYPQITVNKSTVLSFLTRNAGSAIYGGVSFSAV
jgi:hypothetical protein